MLAIDVARRLDAFELDVRLDVPAGATLVVVGESGAGKTTLLRLVAGLDRPHRGRIALDGTPWFDAARALAVPPEGRDIALVPQDGALFPHLTVAGNVGFGLAARGLERHEIRRRVGEILERLGLGDLGGRKPAALSGGQRQRAALARALVVEPRVLLLDEPLSALDRTSRQSVRSELRQILAATECTTLYVTHSALEALALADVIAVMEAGRLRQTGTPDDLLRHPRSPYVADLMGVNLFRTTVRRRTPDGLADVRTVDGGTLTIVDPGDREEVFVAVSPREIPLFLEPPAGSAQNVFRGPVREMVPEPPFGERVRVVLDTHPRLVAEVTRHAVTTMGLTEGRTVYAAIKATAVVTYE